MAQNTYIVTGMDCAECAQKVEKGVTKLDGVQNVRVDFMTGKLRVDGSVSGEQIRERLEALGYGLQDAQSQRNNPTLASGNVALSFLAYLLGRPETRHALLGGLLILVALFGRALGIAAQVTGALSVGATLIALYPIARSGVNNLRINHDFNINLLMTIAAFGALFIGEMLEAATVIFLFAIGEALEGYTTERARASLRSLMNLTPTQALRLDEQDNETLIAVELLQPGDRILVKAGERIPMDGVVLAGESSVDQAPITGESVPVFKASGAEVFAGTINGVRTLQIQVTRRAADNTLSRIIQLVEAAQSNRAQSQRLIDRFARYYTPAIVMLAALVISIPPLVFGAPFYDTVDGRGWLYRGLVLLVIACPCALVISTPVTIISAIMAAARRGVLIKGGAHLETLGRVKAFAFDKTGTLTRGEPMVTASRSVECNESIGTCAACDDLLALAYAVERGSSHPLAQAIVNEAHARGLNEVYSAAQDVEMLTGRGVHGRVNGQRVTVGSHQYFETAYPHNEQLCALIDKAEGQGQTALLLADGDKVRGFIAVADQIRPNSRAVIEQLKALGLHTAMLTGDNRTVAETVGREIGADEIRAVLLPADKLQAVGELRKQYGETAMVGDGVNDTPALAAASVGIAMGGAGSAQALETADVALMADDLKQLPFAVRLARFARRLIFWNVGLSLGLKVTFVILALFGTASLWLAIAADVGMLLAVTLNGMRPLRMR